jgi:hypothetical protein
MTDLYHFFMFNGTPDLTPYGIRHDALFLGHHALFPRHNGKPDASGWIDEDQVRLRLQDYRRTGTPVLLDIEGDNHWKTFKVAGDYKIKFRQSGMDLRLRLLHFCRSVNPNLRYGYYREPGGWGSLVLDSETLGEWHEYTRQLVPLLTSQDFCVPQFYFNRTSHAWPAGLEEALLWMERHFAALRFFAPNVPIWPIAWPQWYDLWRDNASERHTSEHRDHCAMLGHVWRAILDYVLPRSDGLFLWGGEGKPPWDSSADWWQVTRELLTQYRTDFRPLTTGGE